jgi:hypothetical protein
MGMHSPLMIDGFGAVNAADIILRQFLPIVKHEMQRTLLERAFT